jgi:hypothetical protein
MSTAFHLLRAARAIILTSVVSVEVSAQMIGPKIAKCTFTSNEIRDFAQPLGWSLKCYATPGVTAAPIVLTAGVGCRYTGSVLLTNAVVGQARLFYKPGAVAPDPQSGWVVKNVTTSPIPQSFPASSNSDNALIARSVQLVTGDTSQAFVVGTVVFERPLGICSKALAEIF